MVMKQWLIASGCVLCSASLIFAATTPDLVKDGGFEQTQRVLLHEAAWIERAMKEGTVFTQTGDEVIIPVNISNFLGTKILKVTEDQPGGKVHSGKRSILLQGGLYISPAAERNYRAREGDMFLVEFYVKGDGDVSLNMNPWGEGKMAVKIIARKETPGDKGWRKIEQTMVCLGAIQSAGPYLSVANEVFVDDLSIRRVLRNDESTTEGVRAKPEELSKVAFACPFTSPPAMDGKLDDACWKDIPETSGFLAYGNQAVLAEPTTSVRVGYDEAALYFGIVCPEPTLGSLVPLLDKFPDLNKEQWAGPTTMELFLDPGRSCVNYYQFAASARGHKYEGLRKEMEWNVPWEVKTGMAADNYTLEIRIPFASLGVSAPAVGDVWGFNVCRNREVTHSTWNPVGSDFHKPEGFGQLVFGSFEDWFREIFERKTILLCEAIKKNSKLADNPELQARLVSLDRYADEFRQVLKKSGLPKDWRECGKLYGEANFAVDSYGRIGKCLEWISLSEGEN